MDEVACVGVGTVGRSWAVVFLSAGCRVTIFDERRSTSEDASAWIGATLKSFEAGGLIGDATQALTRLSVAGDLAEAVGGALYVQESVPENVDVKKALFTELGRLSQPRAILASSTSELPGRLFMEGVAHRERALVAHPVNPPHLVPAVELSPSPWTSPEIVSRAETFLQHAGQKPIRLLKEIGGFIVNRLQMALIGEALYLVGGGYCSPEDLDEAVRSGLGRRWALMGPFETGHLNSSGGYLDYMTKFRTGMQKLLDDLKVNQQWDEALIRTIDHACQRQTPAPAVAERQMWRDAQLILLRKHFAQSSAKPTQG